MATLDSEAQIHQKEYLYLSVMERAGGPFATVKFHGEEPHPSRPNQKA
jgi:hypothetical protein